MALCLIDHSTGSSMPHGVTSGMPQPAHNQSPTATQHGQWTTKQPPRRVTSPTSARKKQVSATGGLHKQTCISAGRQWYASLDAGSARRAEPPLTKKPRYTSGYSTSKPGTPRGQRINKPQKLTQSDDPIKYIEELLYGVDHLEPASDVNNINWDLDQLGISGDKYSASDISTDYLRRESEPGSTRARGSSVNGEPKVNTLTQLLLKSQKNTVNPKLCSKLQAGKPKFTASRFLKSPIGILHIRSSAAIWKTPFLYPKRAWYDEVPHHNKRSHSAPAKYSTQTAKDNPEQTHHANDLNVSNRWQNLYSLVEDSDEALFSPLTISPRGNAYYRGLNRSTSVNSYSWSDDSFPRNGFSMESATLGSEEMINRYIQSARRESKSKEESLQKYKIRQRMKSLEEDCFKNDNPNICNYCERLGVKKRVVAYCHHCRKRMCKVCCADHENDALTVSHAVVDLTSLSQSAVM